MRKPLLTDEILEREARKKKFGYYDEVEEDWSDEYDLEDWTEDWNDEEWDEDEYTGYKEGQTVRIPVESSIVKSRRIETVKKEQFKSKVNKILFWVIFLLILFLIAVFYF